MRGDVINMYGPTETTIWSSTHVARVSAGTVPIGRPVANTKLYVLDHNRQPVPVGVAGELYIGGRGVARGYLNRPELTAARFVADPFSGHADVRLYRTGDMVRYAEDGTLEFLGRTDHQVKLRGHRIELGEIETVLSRHPTLKEVVVVLREHHSGGPHLVAYYTTVPEASIGDEELRQFSMENLPDYMLPTAFVGLDSFPLTPNRKVDRGRLPAPDQARPELARAFTPARTLVEAALTQIWCEVLGFERIGIHDDFFQLGGNSLSTIQIAFKIRQRLNTELPLSTIFKHPTVAGIADRLEQELLDQADDSTLAGLLEEIEGMTEEEARAFVETAPTAPSESVTTERK